VSLLDSSSTNCEDLENFSDPDITDDQNDLMSKTSSEMSSGSTVSQKAAPVKKPRKTSSIVQEEDNVLRMISNAIRSSTNRSNTATKLDEFDAYGNFIATEMRSVSDPRMRDYIKLEIGKLFFNAKWVNSENVEKSASNFADHRSNSTFMSHDSAPHFGYPDTGKCLLIIVCSIDTSLVESTFFRCYFSEVNFSLWVHMVISKIGVNVLDSMQMIPFLLSMNSHLFYRRITFGTTYAA
jgi:hypothetical protein